MNTPPSGNAALSWIDYMRQGNFEQAWQISDAVLESRSGIPCWHLPRHLQYIWNGQPLEGKKVLVRCYHGLGDTIQFIRYAPLLKTVASSVLVWAQPRLMPLLETAIGIDELHPLHDGTPDFAYDADIELMELPHFFHTTLDTIPKQVPYLFVEPVHLKQNPGRVAVGLVWRSGDWNPERSIPFQMLAPLFALSGVELFILQAQPEHAGWDGVSGKRAGQETLLGDAQVIQGLDLMITVDTMTAHLAGALGKPVWNLLPTPADWRWMENREDSPWFPTMKLFRQEQPGDWQPVIDKVAAALKEFAAVNRAANQVR